MDGWAHIGSGITCVCVYRIAYFNICFVCNCFIIMCILIEITNCHCLLVFSAFDNGKMFICRNMSRE